MASQFSLPQMLPPIFCNNTAANAISCDYICCKNAHKVWFLVFHAGANDTDLTLSFQEGVDVAATGGASAVTETFPIWVGTSVSTTNDTLVRQANAASYVLDPATNNPSLVILEWDPAKHAAGYDCIAVKGTSGHASNTVQIFAFVQQRYKQATPPSAIID